MLLGGGGGGGDVSTPNKGGNQRTIWRYSNTQFAFK